MTKTGEFQKRIESKLKYLFIARDISAEIKTEWPTLAGEDPTTYSPRLDIAVGPFAVRDYHYEKAYDQMVEALSIQLDKWIDASRDNCTRYLGTRAITVHPTNHQYYISSPSNRNARCFMAIEIENRSSRKHLMGSIINAAALGRIGVVIAWTDTMLKATIRMKEYFDFLERKRKPTFNVGNVLVLTADQFESVL